MPCYTSSSFIRLMFTTSFYCIISLVFNLTFCCFAHHGPKCTKSTASNVSKRLCPGIDLESTLKVIKDNKCGKSVMVITWVRLLKVWKNRFLHTEWYILIEWNVYGTLSTFKQIYDDKKKINQANHYTHISEEWNLKKSLRKVLQVVFQKKTLLPREMIVHAFSCPWRPYSGSRWGGRWKTMILMILTLCRPKLMYMFVPYILTKNVER